MNNNLLEIKDLCLSYTEGHNVFQNINFKIKENTINLISGDSGSGKSSLLMCIARVIPETIEGVIKGEIIFQGENLEKKDVHYVAGTFAYMFQDPDSQLCTFTVADEIAFALENLKVPSEAMEKRVDEILSLVGIEALKYRQLNHLSGGEQQKVALASILALDPKLILMDEPTANLDPVSTREMISLIKRLRDDMGKTILIIEHKIKEFAPIADTVIKFKRDGAETLSDPIAFSKEYTEKHKLPKIRSDISKNESIPVLEVKNLSFSYENKKQVLQDISFNLNKGEILAVVGHNGAGKSTLSKILMGLKAPLKGEVKLKGKDIRKMSVSELGQHMGLVFQNPEHQFIKMSVYKELALSLELHGIKEEVIKEKTNLYLEKFRLFENREDNPFTLSQGQKRRLSTAAMMINGQEVLILDEPTYGQDRENLIELVNLLYEVNKRGMSILIITHDLDLVYNCCHRVVALEKGKINEAITTGEALRAYFKERGVKDEGK